MVIKMVFEEKDLKRIKYGLKLLLNTLKEGDTPHRKVESLIEMIDRQVRVCPNCREFVTIQNLHHYDKEKSRSASIRYCPNCKETFGFSTSGCN